MKQSILPEPLKKGASIAVISPAGFVERSAVQETLQKIEKRGFSPILGRHAFKKYDEGYNYAGTESERLSDLNWALNDSEIDAVWATRGGYGCMHLLPHLDLENFKNKPKWYVGYSDNTALQSFLLKNGYASVAGQTLKTSSFGVSDKSYSQIFDIFKGKLPKYNLNNHRLNKPGSARGTLVGGNLALIYALLGTPYSFAFQDNILFMEEIGEEYYALDRMLTSLDLAGIFTQISGLVIGGMTLMGEKNKNRDDENSFDEFAFQLISNRLKNYNFPVYFGFPNGHIFHNLPLIIGHQVSLTVGNNCSLNYI